MELIYRICSDYWVSQLAYGSLRSLDKGVKISSNLFQNIFVQVEARQLKRNRVLIDEV